MRLQASQRDVEPSSNYTRVCIRVVPKAAATTNVPILSRRQAAPPPASTFSEYLSIKSAETQTAYWKRLHDQLSRTDEDYNCGAGPAVECGYSGGAYGGGAYSGAYGAGSNGAGAGAGSASADDPWRRAKREQLAAAAAPPPPVPVPMEDMLLRLAPEIKIVPVSIRAAVSDVGNDADADGDAIAKGDDTSSVETIGLPHTAGSGAGVGANADGSSAADADAGSAADNLAAFFKFKRPDVGHGNICPIYGVLEAEDCYFVVQPYRRFTLQHTLMYDASQVSDSHAKPLFIVYVR